MTDIERICRECGQRFVITVEEQAWLRRRVESKGVAFQMPKRCDHCRAEAWVRDHTGYKVELCCQCGKAFAARLDMEPPVYCRSCWEQSLVNTK